MPAARHTGLPAMVPAWYTGPERRQLRQQLAPAQHRGHRQAAADDLAERGEVGLDA